MYLLGFLAHLCHTCREFLNSLKINSSVLEGVILGVRDTTMELGPSSSIAVLLSS